MQYVGQLGPQYRFADICIETPKITLFTAQQLELEQPGNVLPVANIINRENNTDNL